MVITLVSCFSLLVIGYLLKCIKLRNQLIKEQEELIAHLKQSRSNLDEMLDQSLKGQDSLLNFISNFNSYISSENRKILTKWKIDIAHMREVYIDRWRAKAD